MRSLVAIWLAPSLTAFLVSGLVSGITLRVRGEEDPSLETAAARLQKTVVTVRIQGNPSEEHGPAEEDQESGAGPRVTVCSGVLLGDGRIVTSAAVGGNRLIRVTLPGGEQAVARVGVVDEYSGLSLLEIENDKLAGIPCAETPPQVGAWVLSGAGWGAEEPVISCGIVSGLAVAVPQTTFPPLLRCDMRIAQTSSGAAVANRNGELVGVVVLAERAGERRGWTYAVPVTHVLRLTRTLAASSDKDAVVVLERRRPIVGMVLDGDGQRVLVSRVRDNSPASRAGIQVGDEILAADNVKIRSVYQALRPVLRKQPGDRVSFSVLRDNRQRDIPVVLGGGVKVSSAPPVNRSRFVQPTIDVESLARGGIRSRSTVGEVREFGHAEQTGQVSRATGEVTAAEKIELLEKALDRYHEVVAQLIQQLEESQDQYKRAASRIQSLEKKLEGRTSDGNSH